MTVRGGLVVLIWTWISTNVEPIISHCHCTTDTRCPKVGKRHVGGRVAGKGCVGSGQRIRPFLVLRRGKTLRVPLDELGSCLEFCLVMGYLLTPDWLSACASNWRSMASLIAWGRVKKAAWRIVVCLRTLRMAIQVLNTHTRRVSRMESGPVEF
jgi:hypothetical protein